MAAVEAVQQGAGNGSYRMELIPAGVPVGSAGGEILYDIPAKIDVDDLQAAADAEDRLAVQNKGVEKIELGLVQMRIDRDGTAIFLAEPVRVDVSAAGKQQTVAAGGHLRPEADHKGHAAGSERRFIIFGVFSDTCNENTHMMIEANRTNLLWEPDL